MERVKKEINHFSKVIRNSNFTWWGDSTEAGQLRLDIKAKLLMQYTNLKKGILALEIGCGTGEITKRLLSTEASIIAVDVVPELIKIAQNNIKDEKLSFQIANAEALPFPDNYFDVVLGRSILHHLSLSESIKEIKRVLKNGGKFVFSEPNMLNPHLYFSLRFNWWRKKMEFSQDETAFYSWKIRKDFFNAGFKDVKVFSFDFVHPSLSGWLLKGIQFLSPYLERIPIIREIGGSLFISGRKQEI